MGNTGKIPLRKTGVLKRTSKRLFLWLKKEGEWDKMGKETTGKSRGGGWI